MMAFKSVSEGEKNYGLVQGVTVIFRRILMHKRAGIEKKLKAMNRSRGEVEDHLLVDAILKDYVLGILDDPNDPDTWFLDDDDNRVPPEKFDSGMTQTWPQPAKLEAFELIHLDAQGRDVRTDGNRLGNSRNGSMVSIDQTA